MQWLAEICVHRPVFATVIVMFLTVVGGFSFFTLGVDRFPRVELPTITVQTTNSGAAPQEIESEITDVIEGAVNTVPGIEDMRSQSSRGRSNVTLTFNLQKDPDIAAQEVRDKVSSVVNRLPDTADPPTVQKSDPDSQPVIQYSISKPGSPVELTTLVENLIQKRIESADGVGEIFMYGSRRRQIRVFINPDRLRAYSISVTEVTNAIRNQNLEMPGGNLTEGAKSLGLRTMSRITEIQGFNDIVVASRNGVPIRIKDVGRVEESGEDPQSAARLDGVPGVMVGVRKQPGANTIDVINNVKSRMAQIVPNLPPDIKIAVIRDQSEFIQNSLNSIEEHLILGGIFAAVIVFLFLWNIRSTIIAALAIPISIIASFALVSALGYSLNQMTMLALTLMVGIVIDDAIVVLENIYRFVEEKGMHPMQAAIEGTKEIGLAVLATTLSLLAVFIPVGFMTGIVGRFMSSFGLTAAAAIAVSLIVSFTLTPMLAARWIKPRAEEKESHGEEGAKTPRDSKDSWLYSKVDRGYTSLLKLAMRKRWVVVLICAIVVSSIVPLYKYVGMAFLPDEDESLFQVSVRGPNGTALPAIQSFAERIARDIREEIPGVKNTMVFAGFGRSAGSNNATINVALVPVKERRQSQAELINITRGITKKYASKEYQVSVSASSSIAGSIGLGRGGTGIGFYIAGPDIGKLNVFAQQLVDKMKQDPNFRDPDSSIEVGAPEIRVVIDREKAADLGVQAGNVAQALNILAAGQRVSTFSEGSEQYDVVVQADEQFRRDRNNLQYFTVASQKGGAVGLEKVVKLEEGLSPSSIARLNRQRQVTVTAGLPPNASEAEALTKLQRFAKELNLPAEYTTGVTGQSKELEKAYNAFMLAFILSFVFMYLILAAQFESFIHPVTILLSLPLSIPFALLSTLASGQTLNIFSALGILLLFGIVKKNAILQIDHTNTLRARGMDRYEAIIQANRDRLRPILMTTLALIAGMIPLTIGSGAGAATNRSIGILVVGGQSLCLLLTLIAVPVFYSLFDDAGKSQIWRKVSGRFGWMSARLKPVTGTLADVTTLFAKDRRVEENDFGNTSERGDDKA